MPILIQITLCAATIVLTVFLAMFLFQARRTAAAVERFAESAARDLHQVSTDIHAVKGHAEDVAALVKGTFGLPSALTQVVTGLVRGLPALFTRTSDSTNLLEAVMAAIQGIIALFRKPAAPAEPEQA